MIRRPDFSAHCQAVGLVPDTVFGKKSGHSRFSGDHVIVWIVSHHETVLGNRIHPGKNQ